MDRTKSVNFIIHESDICPWKSQEEDFQTTSIERQVKIITNKNNQSEDMATQYIKQARSQKFYKILEQHRERLMRKKILRNTQSPNSEQKMIIDKKPNIIIKRPQTNPKSSKNLHILAFQEKSYTTLSRAIQQSKYQKKCINPRLVNIYEYERQPAQLIYRPRPTNNKNADKFYGHLSKKDNIHYKYSSNLDFHKLHPILGKTQRLKQSTTYKQNSLSKGIKQKVQLKIFSYRSSKSVQKLRLKIEQKKRKQRYQSKMEKQKTKIEEGHILDRILINR